MRHALVHLHYLVDLALHLVGVAAHWLGLLLGNRLLREVLLLFERVMGRCNVVLILVPRLFKLLDGSCPYLTLCKL